MTEKDKGKIVELWKSGLSLRQIQQMLPYSLRKFRETVAEMKANGEFPTEREKKQDKVAKAVKEGEVNPYVLADTFGVSVRTAMEYKRIFGGVSPKARPKLNYKHCQRTESIMADLKEGKLSLSEIARNHGVTRQAVHKVKKKLEADGEL
jgi:DNA-binding CsgD family transcriptional regulator